MKTAEKLFKSNLLIMRALGYYPPDRFKQIYKIYAYITYVCFIVTVSTSATLFLLLQENIDLNTFGDNSFLTFQMACLIFKLTAFVFNESRVRETIDMLEWPIFNNYTKNQENFLNDCAQVCNRNNFLFLLFCVLSLITWAVTPLIGSNFKPLKLPIDIWLPFNVKNNKYSFIAFYVFLVYGVGNGAISNASIDPLVSGMAYFATTQFKLLKDNLQHLSEYADDELKKCKNADRRNCLKDKIRYNKIIQCVKHHEAIIKFIKNYESVYSPVIFSQFATAVIVICFTCLKLTMVEPFTLSFFTIICFLLTIFLEIFLYSFFGTTLFEESNTLTTAIYMDNWYEYDIKCRKALILLMERSKKPVIITAGNILETSLNTFTTILRRAYSLFAVLQTYQV